MGNFPIRQRSQLSESAFASPGSASLCDVCFRACLQAHEVCGPMEIDSALTTVQTLKNELQDAKMAAADAELKPLPGESVSAHLPDS